MDHAKPRLLKTPVHSRRPCTPNLHPTSCSLSPLAKTGAIYLSTAHSHPDDIAENWVSSSWSNAFVVGQEEVTGGTPAAYVGTLPWHTHQQEVAGVKRITCRDSDPGSRVTCQGLGPLGVVWDI